MIDVVGENPYYPPRVVRKAVASGKVTELLAHPAFPERLGLKEFHLFMPFVRIPESIDPNTRQGFIDYLKSLYERTAYIWAPSNCHATAYLESKARELCFEQDLVTRIEPRTFTYMHFWLNATLKGVTRPLVIDPFGVPTPGIDHCIYPESVIPFFGDRVQAPNNANAIYAAGRLLG